MKKTVSKHIVIKLLKTSAKDKILKEAKGKKKDNLHNYIQRKKDNVNFSLETMCIRQWRNTIKILKGKLSTWNSTPNKISFKTKNEIKTFQTCKKWKNSRVDLHYRKIIGRP